MLEASGHRLSKNAFAASSEPMFTKMILGNGRPLSNSSFRRTTCSRQNVQPKCRINASKTGSAPKTSPSVVPPERFLVETLRFKNELSIFDMVAQPQNYSADNTTLGDGKNYARHAIRFFARRAGAFRLVVKRFDFYAMRSPTTCPWTSVKR